MFALKNTDYNKENNSNVNGLTRAWGKYRGDDKEKNSNMNGLPRAWASVKVYRNLLEHEASKGLEEEGLTTYSI